MGGGPKAKARASEAKTGCIQESGNASAPKQEETNIKIAIFKETYPEDKLTSFHQLLHNQHHLSSGAGTICQEWLQYQVDSVSPH
jgi:hypoxanthine phosphoribosyltransferase